VRSIVIVVESAHWPANWRHAVFFRQTYNVFGIALVFLNDDRIGDKTNANGLKNFWKMSSPDAYFYAGGGVV